MSKHKLNLANQTKAVLQFFDVEYFYNDLTYQFTVIVNDISWEYYPTTGVFNNHKTMGISWQHCGDVWHFLSLRGVINVTDNN